MNMITSFFKPKRDRAAAADKENTTAKEGAGQNKKLKTTTNLVKQPKQDDTPEASALISYLHDESSSAEASSTWKSALDKHFSSSSFRRLASFVETER